MYADNMVVMKYFLIHRTSSVFNAFLSTLPQMLDQNHLMGGSILEAVLHVLLYAPSNAPVASANSESSHNIIYSYSLWRLEPHVRRNWLMAVQVIMYKVYRALKETDLFYKNC